MERFVCLRDGETPRAARCPFIAAGVDAIGTISFETWLGPAHPRPRFAYSTVHSTCLPDLTAHSTDQDERQRAHHQPFPGYTYRAHSRLTGKPNGERHSCF